MCAVVSFLRRNVEGCRGLSWVVVKSVEEIKRVRERVRRARVQKQRAGRRHYMRSNFGTDARTPWHTSLERANERPHIVSLTRVDSPDIRLHNRLYIDSLFSMIGIDTIAGQVYEALSVQVCPVRTAFSALSKLHCRKAPARQPSACHQAPRRKRLCCPLFYVSNISPSIREVLCVFNRTQIKHIELHRDMVTTMSSQVIFNLLVIRHQRLYIVYLSLISIYRMYQRKMNSHDVDSLVIQEGVQTPLEHEEISSLKGSRSNSDVSS